MHKIRVGVLMGGKSIEREVSFNSGRTVCDHLDTQRYDIVPIFQDYNGSLFILPWQFLHRGKIQDFAHKLHTHAQQIIWDELPQLVDFVFIAVHGRYAEDGTLQAVLELFNIPYLGSGIFASALSMDKIIQKSFLRKAGIRVPRDVSLSAAHALNPNLDELLVQLKQNNIEFPVVVKPHMEGSSLGISVVFSADQLRAAVINAATVFEKPQAVLIEQKISGMEFSCIVLMDYRTGKPLPLPPTEIVPEASSHLFDYEQKYMPGRATKYTPPRCKPEIAAAIQATVVCTMQALNFTTMARIDGFVDAHDNVVIVDPNTLSGMAPSSFLFREAAEMGMGHSDLINYLIETELHQYGMLPSEQQEKSMGTYMKKKQVAVLLGGASNEREISLESGRNVIYKLSPQKYEVTPIFVNSSMQLYPITQSLLVRNATYEIEPLLDKHNKITWDSLKEKFDFVFLGLHGGQGEDGTVQGMLEMLGIPYNGSGVLTSALCMDKYKTAHYLAEHSIAVPQGTLISKEQWEQEQTACLEQFKQFSFPVIVKPSDDGCSVLVRRADTKEQLIEHTNALFKTKNHALIEQYIIGMELTVGVIGNDEPIVFQPSQAIAQRGVLSIEEKFLPGAGENQTPAPLDHDATRLVQKTVGDAYRVLQCKGYARIDCFYQTADQSPTGEPRVVILEANTLPALTPATCLFHQAAEIGLRPMELLDRIVEYGLELHGNQEQVSHSKSIPASVSQEGM